MINFAVLSTVIATVMIAVKTYVDAHPGTTSMDTRSLLYTLGAAALGIILSILAFYGDPATASILPVPWLTLISTGIAASLPPGLGVSLLTLLAIHVTGDQPTAQDAPKTRPLALLWN